jgi:phosphohistidine phosphatase
MRRLLILRHAKAEPHGAAPDFERGLTERGRAAAQEMGRYCRDELLLPDLALVSPARRTRETWQIFARELGSEAQTPTNFPDLIYQATENSLIDLVRTTSDTVKILIIVGHNPSVSDLARVLVGHGDRYASARMQSAFPTASLAVLDCDVEHWADVARRGGRLDRFRVPSSHPAD